MIPSIVGVLWLLLLAATCAVAHTCMQNAVFDINELMSVSQTYVETQPGDNNTQPLRLRIDTTYLDDDLRKMTCYTTGQVVDTQSNPYQCGSSDVLTTNLRQYMGNLLSQAQILFQSSLKVIPVQGNLVLQGSTFPQGLYGGVYLSPEYTDEGVPDTDVVIFVTARPIVQDGGSTGATLAVARVVQEDQVGRPVFGHLNINPAGMDVDSAEYGLNFGVVIHEMTHALGFNIQKFQRTNPPPGQPADITKKIVLNVGANDRTTTRTLITSPRVVAWAKRFYGCDSIQGVELEDQGGSGTNGSHWEKRVVMNEYMAGTASRNPVFSELTLSVMEDTGWYRANYSLAGQLLWGQGMGCDFVQRGCDNWPSGYNGYFCTSPGKKGCTADYQAKGECQIGTASSLPPLNYQYFPSDPYRIGAYDLPDYCPITWGYSEGWCFDSSSKSTGITDMGEAFGSNSRCFSSSLAKGLALAGSTESACYESYCTGPRELRVKLGGYWYICPAGSEIKIIGFGGTLGCPAKIQQVCGSINGTLGSLGGESEWPTFIAISPNSGGPGTLVNITGKNFVAGSKVTIGDPLNAVEVVSSTLITAIIPTSNRFKNPTNIIQQRESVIIIDTKGRSSVGYEKFTIKVKLDEAFLKNAADYLRDNWLITVAIVVAIALTCVVCGYCCYRQKGKSREDGETDNL